MPAKKATNELKLTRLYDAPVKVVWDAWNDPKKAAKWWGPRGFTITTHSKDLRPGGTWDYTMHGPDGVDYPNITKYLEVEKYSKMVYDHGGSKDRPPMFRVTVLFTELSGKTKMDMTMTLPTVEAAENTKKYIKKAGGDSCWDRLGEYLGKENHHKEQFIINRTFDAPKETLYKMWTDPKHLSQWLAPTGMEMKFIRADIKTGGNTFYMMGNGKDLTMYGRTKYIEISPDKLIYTQQFCDEKENISRHPHAPTWPETMLTTVVFADEGDDQTRVTITWEPFGNATAEEVEMFVKSRAGMTQGWTGSLDKLEDYLLQ